jgi:hypothetical protein
LEAPTLVKRSILKHANRNPDASPNARPTPEAPSRPGKAPVSKASRNKANTIRNSAKFEQYLMQIEKSQGFARSWELRERLEQGEISFDELVRR